MIDRTQTPSINEIKKASIIHASEFRLKNNIPVYHINAGTQDLVKIEDADKAIETELEKIKNTLVEEKELQKVQNKVEATLEFSEMNIMNKALNLAVSELFGDADLANHEAEKYLAVTPAQVKEQANKIFRKENCSTLYYLAKNN